MAQQPPVGQGHLIIEDSRSYSDTHTHLVGLLWTGNQLIAETSTWQNATLTTDRPPWARWDSNLQSQQESGLDPRLRPRGHWDRHGQNFPGFNLFLVSSWKTFYMAILWFSYSPTRNPKDPALPVSPLSQSKITHSNVKPSGNFRSGPHTKKRSWCFITS